jgi:hypothetical protein
VERGGEGQEGGGDLGAHFGGGLGDLFGLVLVLD